MYVDALMLIYNIYMQMQTILMGAILKQGNSIRHFYFLHFHYQIKRCVTKFHYSYAFYTDIVIKDTWRGSSFKDIQRGPHSEMKAKVSILDLIDLCSSHLLS